MRVLAAVAVLVFAISGSASAATVARGAAKRPGSVALKVGVSGFGTIRVPGNRPFTCRSAAASAISCHEIVHVRRGRRIIVRALAASGWKLTTWAGACKGSGTTCLIRPQTPRSVAVTFVPPGDRLNPYRIGKAVRMPEFEHGGVWRMKVNSATINADTAIEAVIDPHNGQPYNALRRRDCNTHSSISRSPTSGLGQPPPLASLSAAHN
jgi:hypothetical protein